MCRARAKVCCHSVHSQTPAHLIHTSLHDPDESVPYRLQDERHAQLKSIKEAEARAVAAAAKALVRMHASHFLALQHLRAPLLLENINIGKRKTQTITACKRRRTRGLTDGGQTCGASAC